MALPEDEAKRDPETNEESPTAVDSTTDQAVDPSVGPDDPLAAALEEAEKFRDMALRAEAEMQNMQRRTARDVENAHKFGAERLLQNLIPVVDSLEKAVEVSAQASQGGDDPIAEGVRLCYKLLVDVLAKENVEILDPVGEPFNPQEHQAISTVENSEMEPSSIATVVQKGYKLNGRVVRAAMVMVTRAGSGDNATSGGQAPG